MPNKKISQLPVAGVLSGTEPLPTVQLGVTVKTTVQDVANLASGSTFTFPNTSGLTQADVGKLLMNTADGLVPTQNTAPNPGSSGWIRLWADFYGQPLSRLLRVEFSGGLPTDGQGFNITGNYSSGIINQFFYWRTSPSFPYDILIGADIEDCIDNLLTTVSGFSSASDISVTKINASTIEINCAPDTVEINFPIDDYFQNSISVSVGSGSFIGTVTQYRSATNMNYITDNYWFEVYDNVNQINIQNHSLFDLYTGSDKLGINKWGRIIPTSSGELLWNVKATLESLLTQVAITLDGGELLITQTYIPEDGFYYNYWGIPPYISYYEYAEPVPKDALYVRNPVVGKLIAVSESLLTVNCSFVFKIKTAGDVRFSAVRRSELSPRILLPTDDGVVIPINEHPLFVNASGYFSADEVEEGGIWEIVASVPMYEALEEVDAGTEVLVRQNTLLANIYLSNSSSYGGY